MEKMAKYVPQIVNFGRIAKNISQKSIKLFDVSLRDGIQPIKKIYTLDEKKDLLHKIIEKYNPSSIEIGSIVNPKIVPQMANSIELHNIWPKFNCASIMTKLLLIKSEKLYLENKYIFLIQHIC